MGFEWSGDKIDLGRAITRTPAQIGSVLYATTEYYAKRMEADAKTNASWQDQTGNARQGLRGYAEHGALVHSAVLAHSVPYGIWLETRWTGRYAIILPTILDTAPDVMASLRGAL